MNTNHHSPKESQIRHQIGAHYQGWKYLEFTQIHLQPDESWFFSFKERESALVPLSGAFDIVVKDKIYALQRKNVFEQMPEVLYCPPNHEVSITAKTECQFSVGSAPAKGIYPLRLFFPHEMKREVRGGGAAQRQVNHILSYPLPAERLILFEVYIPGGAWSGWPPHCHDGSYNSPYLEETYLYQFSESFGSGFHRNYCKHKDFNEVYSVKHGDLVCVTEGFHPTIAAPGSVMYFLNYLSGDLYDEKRSTPPVDDPDISFMKNNWTAGQIKLPLFEPKNGF